MGTTVYIAVRRGSNFTSSLDKILNCGHSNVSYLADSSPVVFITRAVTGARGVMMGTPLLSHLGFPRRARLI